MLRKSCPAPSVSAAPVGAVAAKSLVDDGLDRLQSVRIKIGSFLKNAQKIVGEKIGQPEFRALWQFRPPYQGCMPQFHVRRAFDQLVQGGFANLRRVVAQQIGDCANIIGRNDAFGNSFAHAGALGNGVQPPPGPVFAQKSQAGRHRLASARIPAPGRRPQFRCP